jgi:hypothetical protein
MPSLPPEIAAESDSFLTVPPDKKKTPCWLVPVTAPRFVTVPAAPETTIPPGAGDRAGDQVGGGAAGREPHAVLGG